MHVMRWRMHVGDVVQSSRSREARDAHGLLLPLLVVEVVVLEMLVQGNWIDQDGLSAEGTVQQRLDGLQPARGLPLDHHHLGTLE